MRKIVTGTASEHDSTHFDEVLDENNTSADVYADRGYYPSKARGGMLQALGKRQQARNRRIAKTRARVEHVFAQLHHMGKRIRTIGQARATAAMTMMAVCYNIKRLARMLEDGVDGFFTAKPSKTELRLLGAKA